MTGGELRTVTESEADASSAGVPSLAVAVQTIRSPRTTVSVRVPSPSVSAEGAPATVHA